MRGWVCGLFVAWIAVVPGQAGRGVPAPDPLARRATSYQDYFEAREMLTEGRTEDARHKLEEVLAADPDAADVYATLARLCLREGDLVCAEARGRRAVELAPDNADAEKVLAEIGLQRYQRSHESDALDAALAHLATAATAQPLDASVWNMWIRALAGEGRVAEAETVARRAASVPGLDPASPWMALARALLTRGAASTAIEILDRVEAPGRGAIPILEMLADLKGSAGDLAGQANALEKLRRLKPDDTDIPHRLGALRLELGDFFGALSPLRDAFKARPGDALVRRDLARALVRLGKGAEAIGVLKDLPENQRGPHTLILWAQAAEQTGAFAESADRLEELLAKLADEDRQSYGLTVRLHAARNRLRAGQIDRALGLTKEDDEPVVLQLRLEALDAAGRTAEADSSLRERRRAHPDALALVALMGARAARSRGRDAGLETTLAEIRTAANKGVAAAETAKWLTAFGEPQLGASLLDAVGLSEKPTAGQLRARATTLYAAGRLGEAEAAYRRLLEDNPQDDGALNDLGFLLASQGRSLDEAVKMLERALQIRPDEPAYLDSLAWALHRSGRSADALPLLKKAAQRALDRDEPGIREHLGDVYLALGDSDRARAEWEAALAMGSDQKDRLRKKLAELVPGRGDH